MGKSTARSRAYALARKEKRNVDQPQQTSEAVKEKNRPSDLLPQEYSRASIYLEVATLLPDGQRGNTQTAALLLLRLSQMEPSTKFMSDAILLRRIRHIAETQTLTAEYLAYALNPKGPYFTLDGYFKVRCWSCDRLVCLFPGAHTDYAYNVQRRKNIRGDRHEHSEWPIFQASPLTNAQAAIVGQPSADIHDGSRELSQSRRDFNGQFGSLPTFDNHEE